MGISSGLMLIQLIVAQNHCTTLQVVDFNKYKVCVAKVYDCLSIQKDPRMECLK